MALRGSIANMVTAATMIRLASAHEIHLMAMGAFPVRTCTVMTTARWLPHDWSPRGHWANTEDGATWLLNSKCGEHDRGTTRMPNLLARTTGKSAGLVPLRIRQA